MALQNLASGGHVSAELDGTRLPYVKEVSGGQITTDEVKFKDAGSNYVLRAPGVNKISPFKFVAGAAGFRDVFQAWVQPSIDGQPIAKSGAVSIGDSHYRTIQQCSFYDAHFKSLQAPTLNATKGDSTTYTLEFNAQNVDWRKGDGSKLPSVLHEAQHGWNTANFRLTVDGVGELTTATEVSFPKIEQKVVEQQTGLGKYPLIVPGGLELGGAWSFTVAKAEWLEMIATMNSFYSGMSETGNQYTASVEVFKRDGKTLLYSVELFGVWFKQYNGQDEKNEGGSLQTVKVEAICDNAKYTFA